MIGVAITVQGIVIISFIVRVRLWSVDSTEDSVLMEMYWLNIVLIIESVIEHMVILVIDLVTHLVLISWVPALMILIDAMCVLIRSHISVI